MSAFDDIVAKSAIDDNQKKSVIDDIPESQRSTTLLVPANNPV